MMTEHEITILRLDPPLTAAQIPLTVADVRAQLRNTSATEEGLIQTMLLAAFTAVENHLESPLAAASYVILFAGASSPTGRFLSLPLHGISSITAIRYRDGDDVLQTLDSSEYTFEERTRRIVTSGGFPAGRDFEVEVIAGTDYTASPVPSSQIPQPVEEAILMIAANMFRFRESHMPATEVLSSNPVVDWMLNRYRKGMGL